MAMQAAQILKQLRIRPKRTIRVVLWMNEENGLMGARTYGEDHKSELANHFAAIEADSGSGRPLGIYASGKPELLSLLQPLAGILQSQGAGITTLVEDAGADISVLKVAGVPTFAPIQDTRTYFHYHHTAADTLDKVDPRDLQENCAVVAALTYTLASMSQSLPR
jgi:Zn-dependent M28 family amino/carboxypeptidase